MLRQGGRCQSTHSCSAALEHCTVQVYPASSQLMPLVMDRNSVSMLCGTLDQNPDSEGFWQAAAEENFNNPEPPSETQILGLRAWLRVQALRIETVHFPVPRSDNCGRQCCFPTSCLHIQTEPKKHNSKTSNTCSHCPPRVPGIGFRP